ncbi:hypothetical protein P5V15_006261 [Pogonomyrmex californicus]
MKGERKVMVKGDSRRHAQKRDLTIVRPSNDDPTSGSHPRRSPHFGEDNTECCGNRHLRGNYSSREVSSKELSSGRLG